MTAQPISQVVPRSRYLLAALLFAVPWTALLALPVYSRIEPRLGPFPMFYWWTALWIIGISVATYAAFLLLTPKNSQGRRA